MGKFFLSTVRCALFVTLCLLIMIVANSPTAQRKVIYPFRYRDKVEEYSARYSVDKYLAVSVMKVESNFTEGAISKSGAVGLMQIMPETAYWIAYRLEEDPPSITRLHDCDTNIKYGIWYLGELEDEFFGNDILALAAYNAGRGNVWDWMEEGGWQKNFSDVDSIPYSETRNYVKKVLACREKYYELYGTPQSAGKLFAENLFNESTERRKFYE